MKSLMAVHDDDLADYLDGLGLLPDLQAGLLRCKVCDDVVTFDTLHSLVPENGAIRVICSKSACVHEHMRLLSSET